MAKLTHDEAAKLLTDAGITWKSSGNCSDRTNRRCTSFDQINSRTIDGIIAFKKESGCSVVITGGTEVGHAGGAYSHSQGFKLDITPSESVSKYIESNYKYDGVRRDGAKMYKSSTGNVYAREKDHWDITYM